jgi:hypothetical protein
VTAGTLSKRQLGDLFLRSVMSTLFLPGSQSDEVPALVASLFAIAPTGKTKARRTGVKAG